MGFLDDYCCCCRLIGNHFTDSKINFRTLIRTMWHKTKTEHTTFSTIKINWPFQCDQLSVKQWCDDDGNDGGGGGNGCCCRSFHQFIIYNIEVFKQSFRVSNFWNGNKLCTYERERERESAQCMRTGYRSTNNNKHYQMVLVLVYRLLVLFPDDVLQKQ